MLRAKIAHIFFVNNFYDLITKTEKYLLQILFEYIICSKFC